MGEVTSATHALGAKTSTDLPPGGRRAVFVIWLIWIIWLPFLIPGAIQFLQTRPGPLGLVATSLGVALFVAVYLRTNWNTARDLASPTPPAPLPPTPLWASLVVLFALAIALCLPRGGVMEWGSLYIFAGVTAAGRLPTGLVLSTIAAVELVIGGSIILALLGHGDRSAIATSWQGMLLIGFTSITVLGLVRGIATNRELQAAREEIARLARERVEHELNTARRIQLSLLPKETPALEGWSIATYYQPAREVGGDFYDFLPLADGRLGIVLGDVTDKGVPAALVMATTRSMLRAAAPSSTTPGAVLARVNELLCADLPASMFVTCFYAILDPLTGRLCYANAGQDLPYLRRADASIVELRAAGMPLGLMPAMTYDEHDIELAPTESVVFYSDGLVEAHNARREMFGFPRLAESLGRAPASGDTIAMLLGALADFTGAGWEQEDDVTLLTLRRTTVS